MSSTTAVLDSFDGRIAEADLRLELVDHHHLVLSGDGGVPAGITVAAQPRFADDLPAGPLRHRLARLLDVRALLRLVEVTSRRTGDEAQRVGKGDRCGDRPPITVGSRHRSGRPAPRRGDRVDRLPETGGRVARSARRTGLREGRQRSCRARRRRCRGLPQWLRVSVGVPLAGDGAAIDGFRAVLANLRGAMVANWDGTVDDIDPEFSTTCASPYAGRESCSPTPSGCSPTTCASAPVKTSPGSAGSPGPPVTSTSTRSSGPTTRPTSMPPPPRTRPAAQHLGVERQAARRAGDSALLGAGGRGGGALEVARQSGRRGSLGDRGSKHWRRRSLGGSAGPTG